MGEFDPLKLAGQKAKGKRPFFLKDPDVERVMTITMAIAQELGVMRERMDTIERLLEDNGSITRTDIENYNPSTDIAEQRGAWTCLLYTSPSPRDATLSRMPSSA